MLFYKAQILKETIEYLKLKKKEAMQVLKPREYLKLIAKSFVP